MHILATTAASIDGLAEPVDLRQAPAPMVVLSFTDSDLAGLAAAHAAERDAVPELRLVHLRDLRHPMSVDLWLERTGVHARLIVLRLLGGPDWWRYGVERLAEAARAQGIALAVLPGEDGDDPRLAELGTLPAGEHAALLAYFREGGIANLRALLRRMAGHAGVALEAAPPHRLPRAGAWKPGVGEAPVARDGDRPVVPILFYRSMLLAEDAAPVAALAEALEGQGIAAVPLFVASLKEAESLAFVREAMAALRPSVIVATTGFASGDAAALGAAGVPVLQAVMATTSRAAWEGSPRGLGGADLAMHVVLPELDGRVLAGALSFKEGGPGPVNRVEPDRVAQVAARVAALIRLQRTARAERRVAVLIPDYPGAGGRAGYAVGLDVPESVRTLLLDLAAAGYTVGPVPETSRELMEALERSLEAAPIPALPSTVTAAWAETDAARFRALRFGNVTVAIAPDRGRAESRRADWHDPALPPHPALLGFGAWLRANVDAVVHMGAHGAIEWLPGKAVALTADCFPERVLGALPVVYPFLVSNPGEAAQAKRRIAAVTLGHLPPRLAGTGLHGATRDLERLLDEYAVADGLDPRRRERLAKLILEQAGTVPGLAPGAAPQEVLKQLDSWLCDLKELAIKDGLHVLGRAEDEQRRPSAEAERRALLEALDGRAVAAGPGGAPARGRRDVLPTGRNLYAADPRGLPTETAMDLGRLAAEEVVRLHLQEQGEMPRAVVTDLWASATLRSGGEEIAQGLALMGCRPVWDAATGRVTGIEVLPPAVMGRPRVDVTFRLSGLFRDLFPAQIALLDAATRAVAAREEEAGENPLAAAPGPRIFGAAPGAYGAGIEDALASGGWTTRDALGRAYLDAASHAYGGVGGDGLAAPGAFEKRVAAADALLHGSDDPARDLLEGSADSAHLGGFASAARLLGTAPLLISLDTTDPSRPRARPLAAQLARLVHGRIAPRFVEGQMRHGPRGASELAETVDRLVAFAETTDSVPDSALDAVHDAYLGDDAVRDFLARENPAALRAIARRFADARRRGLWHPRANDVDAGLAALLAEAA
ncbi:cobaltochelatase subunit CobN [Roseococcus sp. SYP-B2431]|uniref:cobaltochelatase subunit CobN n=1 Tax=Roseococcus sp. SYP-B2431 TaxID=2496640 RepID=UPI00103A237C|nr:cobaltochelatase subunit CobN [Roseococcus sp. SYP-B2431]TCH98172.1 cobaltochelatase subunit CobN [Roseococcus sp. SYP-B2431]